MLSKTTGQYPYEKDDLKKRVELDASHNEIYVGYAQPGTATDEAKWQICKKTYDVDNYLTQVDWAEGTHDYDKVWDDRASYSYS